MADRLLVDAAPKADQRRAHGPFFVVPVLGAYLLSRLLLVPIALGASSRFSELAQRWDSRYYFRIAAHGYPTSLPHHGTSVVAFFPLFPMLIRMASPAFGHDWVTAGMTVSLVTGATACLAVGALVRDRFGHDAGLRAGVLFAFAPGAAFLSWGYAEGLAISLCAVSLLMLDRRRWLAAGLLGALATAASSLAAPIVVAAIWAAWRSGQGRAWIAPVLGASGFGAFCLYLWVHLGTPFGWFDAERIGWDAHIDPVAPISWLARHSGISAVETLCLAAAAGGIWAMHRARVPGTWWAFTVPLLCSVNFSAELWLTPRFLLGAFPLIAGAAVVARGERFRTLLLSCGVVMVVVLVAYSSWGFVYQP